MNEAEKLKHMYKNLNYSLKDLDSKNPILLKLFKKYQDPKKSNREYKKEEPYLPLFL